MKFTMTCLVTMALMTSTVLAQSNWTFTQLIQATLTSHPLVLGKRSAQAAAQAESEGAEWQRYPSLTIEANSKNKGQNGSLLRLDQPLWTGGRITAGIDAASSRLDAAGAALEEARQELTLKVVAASIEGLRQQARQQHNEAGVRAHEKLLEMIQRRVAQEVSPLADQRLAASRLYSASNELSTSKQALQNALAQLEQLAGQPVKGIAEPRFNTMGMPTDLEAAVLQSQAHSPILRRLAFEEEAANAEIVSKRSVYMPQLVLRLENSVSDLESGRHSSDNRAMLVLLAQPGAGFSAKSGEDAAIAKREAARQAREAARRELLERVTQDWNEWLAARQRLEYAQLALAMTTEVSESYARQYTTGRKTWIDVLNAVREATQSELAVDDASSQMLGASLRLRTLSGTLTGTPSGIQ